jgi:hypothetical protein
VRTGVVNAQICQAACLYVGADRFRVIETYDRARGRNGVLALGNVGGNVAAIDESDGVSYSRWQEIESRRRVGAAAKGARRGVWTPASRARVSIMQRACACVRERPSIDREHFIRILRRPDARVSTVSAFRQRPNAAQA